MADSISKVETDLKLKVTMTKDLGIDGATNPEIVQETGTNAKADFSPTTTVPMSVVWTDTRTFATTESLDLTALPQANFSANVDMTGLRVQVIKIIAASSNGANIQIDKSGVNGYFIWGASADSVTLLPGCAIEMVCNNNMPLIGATAKSIDVSGTGTLTYDIQIVAG